MRASVKFLPDRRVGPVPIRRIRRPARLGSGKTSSRWLDGVGPVEARPRTIDVHFGTEIGYDFGTNEFIAWCRRVGAEPLINWNMGTGTLDEAIAWLEYCNRDGNTRWVALRRAHGIEAPHNVRYWQLGNESYGFWEIGQMSAQTYAEAAREWAKAARRIDPSIAIVASAGGSKRSSPGRRP